MPESYKVQTALVGLLEDLLLFSQQTLFGEDKPINSINLRQLQSDLSLTMDINMCMTM